ncbi:restriction endonuclease subunit S [Microbacterium sp.]|uniref:restriction endonuclease subunit S n=1 Tax=Microbacterium sp. TaxID=51671 RepID=UPI003C722973
MPETLSDVCEEIVDCVNRTAPESPDGPYLLVGTPAMRGNIIDESQARMVSAETFQAWTRRLTPRAGDLLLAREAPVGPVVIIPEGGNIGAGQRTTHLRANPSRIHNRFLYYALTAPATQERLIGRAMGSTVAHLRVADIKSFELPTLPPLPEQQAIAEVLGALDDKIAANTRLAATAWELIQGSFQLIQRTNTSRMRLSDVATLEYGKALPAAAREPGDVAVVGSGGVSGSHSQALVTESGVVVGRKGSAGAVHWITGPHFPIDTTFFVRGSAPEFSQPYLYCLLRTLRLNEMNNDSAVPGLNRNEALALPVKVPSAGALLRFDHAAQALLGLIDATSKENRTLAATRDALLPKLMSGQLRVKNAEKILSEVGV